MTTRPTTPNGPSSSSEEWIFFDWRVEGSWALWPPQSTLYPDTLWILHWIWPCLFKHPSEGKEATFSPDLLLSAACPFFFLGPSKPPQGSQRPRGCGAELQGKAWLKLCWLKTHLSHCAQLMQPGNVADCASVVVVVGCNGV